MVCLSASKSFESVGENDGVVLGDAMSGKRVLCAVGGQRHVRPGVRVELGELDIAESVVDMVVASKRGGRTGASFHFGLTLLPVATSRSFKDW